MRKLFILPLLFFLFTPFVLAEFPDVDPNSEHAHAIHVLQELGVVEGYLDGTFQENKEVSRVEFLKMVFLAESLTWRERTEEIGPSFSIDSSGEVVLDEPSQVVVLNHIFPFGEEESILVDTSDFTDFDPEAWYAPYASWGKQEGIIKGYPDGSLGAQEPVIFAEAAKIMVETAGNPNFNKGDHWAEGYFYALGTRVNPPSITAADQVLTRGQVAELIWRYTQATEEELKEKPSRMTTWNEDHFLNLEYVGQEGDIKSSNYYLKNESKIYSISLYSTVFFRETDIDVESFVIDNIQVEYLSRDGHMINREINIARDDFGVYEEGRQVGGSLGGPVKLVENATYMTYEGTLRFYVHDDQTVYDVRCSRNCQLFNPLSYSNAETFVHLAGAFSKDAYNVYSSSRPIEGLDPAHFEHLGSEDDDDLICHFPFFRDENNLYLNRDIVPDVNPDNVEFLYTYGLFFKDENHVYRSLFHPMDSLCYYTETAILQGINPNDFSAIGPNYFISNNSIYYVDNDGQVSLTSADASTFETLLSSDNVDPNDYFVVGPSGKDINHAYHEGRSIEGIDAATFEYDEEKWIWKDKNGSYDYGELKALWE